MIYQERYRRIDYISNREFSINYFNSINESGVTDNFKSFTNIKYNNVQCKKCSHVKEDILKIKDILKEYNLDFVLIDEYKSFTMENKNIEFYYNFLNCNIRFNGIDVDYVDNNIIFDKEYIENLALLKNHLESGYLTSDFHVDCIYFNRQASDTLAHEIIGHLFEVDNYLFFDYFKYLKIFNKFGMTIIDNSNIMNAYGYERFDDTGVQLNENVIMSKGNFSNNLIGGTTNKKIYGNLFRSSIQDKIIPRMTNLYVRSEKYFDLPSDYIEVAHVNICGINHEKKEVYIQPNILKLYLNNTFIGLLKPIKLTFDLDSLIKNIKPIKRSEKSFFRPMECMKKKQIKRCSTNSNAWIIDKLEGDFNELFCR